MFSLYFEANPDLNRLNLPELQGLRLKREYRLPER
jgi:hypothetical protein